MHCRSVQENYLICSSRYCHPFLWNVSINLLAWYDLICVESTIKSKPSSILNRPTFLWLVITLSGWLPLVRKWTTALEKSFYIWVTKDGFKLPSSGNPARSSDACILWRILRRHLLCQSHVETLLRNAVIMLRVYFHANGFCRGIFYSSIGTRTCPHSVCVVVRERLDETCQLLACVSQCWLWPVSGVGGRSVDSWRVLYGDSFYITPVKSLYLLECAVDVDRSVLVAAAAYLFSLVRVPLHACWCWANPRAFSPSSKCCVAASVFVYFL